MNANTDSRFGEELEVIASYTQRAFDAARAELQRQQELTLAMREMVSRGVSVDALSEVTGLTPEQIRNRTEGDLTHLDNVTQLA